MLTKINASRRGTGALSDGLRRMSSAMKTFAVATIIATLLAADCGGQYKRFWDMLEHTNYAGLSPEQLAALSRMALRAYDACLAGDGREAQMLFGRLALLHEERDRSTGPYNPNLPTR
jgi:hypothetical protein